MTAVPAEHVPECNPGCVGDSHHLLGGCPICGQDPCIAAPPRRPLDGFPYGPEDMRESDGR